MKNLFLFISFFVVTNSFSQESIDLANVCWRNSPLNAADSNDAKWNLNSYTVDLKIPVVLNDNNVLIFGLEHQQNSVTSPQKITEKMNFGSSMLQIGWEHKWNKRSKMLFMSMTRLNTDYNDVDIQHFQQGGLALGTTSRSDKFDWKYGLYYNAEFFGPMFVPLFGFNWKINDKWRFKLVAPVNLELSYHPNKWFGTGLRFEGVNGSYRFNQLTNLPGESFHIDKADNNVWVFTEFNFGKNIWFHARAGHSVIRKYRVYDDSDQLGVKLGPVNIGDNRSSATPVFKNGFSFEARFIYRLPLVK